MAVSTSELEKAVESLQTALHLHSSAANNEDLKKTLRDGCIQRFEYSIEFSWKTSMKLLGSTTAAAKPAIREMARNNLISNPDLWLTFIDARNESSHSYDEEVAKKVFTAIQKFIPEATELIKKLKSLA